MFSVDDRNRLRDHVLERARGDVRVVAGAVVGSLANSEGDRWSDLDLTFGVSDGMSIGEVLEDFTLDLRTAFSATQLFDLPSGAAIYRVFRFDLLPQEVRDAATGALARSPDRNELLRALTCAIELLVQETGEVHEVADRVAPQLRQLTHATLG